MTHLQKYTNYHDLIDKLLAFTLPINSVLLLPGIQGTTPPYVFGFAAFLVPLFAWRHADGDQRRGTIFIWTSLVLLWCVFLFLSQFSHALNNYNPLIGYNFISEDSSIILRRSLLSQTLYLVSCFCIYIHFRYWFKIEHLNWVFAGIWFMALYGVYEWLYFLIFQTNGDFLVNRTFESDSTSHSASWSQHRSIAGINLLRIKSTFGEPSFFSGAAVPFFFIALMTRRIALSMVLIFCIIFTWSTTAYIGVFVGLALMGILYPTQLLKILGGTVLLAIGLIVYRLTLPDSFDDMFVNKFTGENNSGAIRKAAKLKREVAQEKLHVLHHFFGIGFGYVYVKVWGSAITNLGYLGAAIFAIFHAKPYGDSVLSGRKEAGWALAAFLLLALYVINLSEGYLPTSWAILGLAYRSLSMNLTSKTSENI